MDNTNISNGISRPCGPCGYPPASRMDEIAEFNSKMREKFSEYATFSICKECPYPECREARERFWERIRMECDHKEHFKNGPPKIIRWWQFPGAG